MILHILLTILKWIGILILCVLGLVLLLILTVLFVPVRYRLRGNMHGEIHVRGSISWLLHILHVSLRYDGDEPVIKFRIFGISLSLGSGNKRTRSHQNRKRKETESAKQQADDVNAENAEEKSEEEAHTGKETDSTETAHTGSKTSAYTGNETSAEAANETDSADAEVQQIKALTGKKPEENGLPRENASEKKGGLFAKIKSFFRFLYTIPQKIRVLLQKIKVTLQAARQAYRSAKDKVTYICSRISHMWNWWQHPDTNKAVVHIKKELRYLWKHAKPRKYAVSLVVGTGDPASTGELLGVLGIVYAWTEGRLQVTPDFAEKRLEADFYMKGRIFGYQLIGIAIRLFLDEHIRSSAGRFRAD